MCLETPRISWVRNLSQGQRPQTTTSLPTRVTGIWGPGRFISCNVFPFFFWFVNTSCFYGGVIRYWGSGIVRPPFRTRWKVWKVSYRREKGATWSGSRGTSHVRWCVHITGIVLNNTNKVYINFTQNHSDSILLLCVKSSWMLLILERVCLVRTIRS